MAKSIFGPLVFILFYIFQRNAAATFNFLLEEERLVGAALIPPQTDKS